MTPKIQQHNPARQKGAAMMISLVFLTVMSLIAVSTMQSSNLNVKMAAQFQTHNRSFEAAETAIAQAMDDEDALNAAFINRPYPDTQANKNLPVTTTVEYGVDETTQAQSRVILVSDKEVACPGYSSDGPIVCIYYKSIGYGWVGSETLAQNPESLRINERGFYRLAPKR